jgi:hypothetical protein
MNNTNSLLLWKSFKMYTVCNILILIFKKDVILLLIHVMEIYVGKNKWVTV